MLHRPKRRWRTFRQDPPPARAERNAQLALYPSSRRHIQILPARKEVL